MPASENKFKSVHTLDLSVSPLKDFSMLDEPM